MLKKTQQGLSLLETILVLAIASMIVILGIRQYQMYRRSALINQAQFNVNTLFQAMGYYYKTNCYGSRNPDQSINPGTLNPAAIPAPANIVPINVMDDLVTPGYLKTSIASILYRTPFVNTGGPGFEGYVVQFNREPDQDRKQCIESDGTPVSGPLASQHCANSVTVATIVNWTIQVSVHLDTPGEEETYLKLLDGDCLSTKSDDIVLPCAGGATGTGDYVVFKRTPLAATAHDQSGLWQMNPNVTQFQQMYTTYPMSYLLSTGGDVPGGGTGTTRQYILCGS